MMQSNIKQYKVTLIDTKLIDTKYYQVTLIDTK